MKILLVKKNFEGEAPFIYWNSVSIFYVGDRSSSSWASLPEVVSAGSWSRKEQSRFE